MCERPDTLANGQKTACRKCKLCLQNKVKDWAGRNVAQSKVSTASFACDLTYGPELDDKRMPIPGRTDHIRAAVLTYSDVQDFLKYVRWLGYEVDYFITGEFGTLKGRAHWHIILHFTGKVPTHEIGINFSDRHKNEHGKLYQHEICKAWPHGFMYWKKAVYEDVFYNCKYILKDEGDEQAQRKPGMSKKPPLGAKYFEKVAEQAVRQGIAPQTLEYRFPEIKKKKTREPVLFWLKGRSAELYLDHFIKTWAEQRPDQPRPRSDLVDWYEQYGQVVADEEALLMRRAFPKGESKEAMPTRKQWRDHKVDVAERKLEAKHLRQDMEAEDWMEARTKDARNEQERQEREDDAQREQWRRALAFDARASARKHAKRLVWQWGKGWVKPGPGQQCDCYVCTSRRESDSESARRELGQYGPGKVGRWNDAFGNAHQPGGNPGSAGPDQASE